jgi:Divergent InlB B-repeat domain
MKRLASTVLLLFALLACPTVASASTHELLGMFATSIPQEGGQFFDDPCGLAVDESQNVAVAVYHGSGYSVARFDSSGSFLDRQKSPLATNAPCDLAYAGSPQHLFGAMLHGAVYDLTQGSVLDPERSTGVAGGPGGRIYVAHRHEVAVYEADGSAAFSVGDANSLGNAYGVAVDPAGRVYVGDAASDSVKVFDPVVDPLVPASVIDGSGTPAGAFSDLTDTDIAIEPNGNVLVVDNLRPGLEHPLAAVLEFNPIGEYVGEISHGFSIEVQQVEKEPAHLEPRTLVHAGPTGVAVASDGTIFVSSGGQQSPRYVQGVTQEGGVVYRFAAGSVPTSRLRVLRTGSGEGSVESFRVNSAPPVFSGIQCGPTCTGEYKNGETVTLVATPSAHSEFRGWSVAGQPNACLDVNASCQLTLSAARDVTAEFAAIPQRDLQVSVSGQGLVSSTPSRLTCRSQCSAEFDDGSQVTLTPEPAEGFRFEGFSGACSGQSSCTVAMTRDLSVGANFAPASAPERVHLPTSTGLLLLIAGGDGTGAVSSDPAGLDCGLVCSATFPSRTGLTLKASADPGSRFVGWSGCDSVAAGRCRVAATGVRSVTASFAEGPAVALGRLVTRRSKTSLVVKVAEAGRLSLKGKGLRDGRRRVGAAGNTALPLRPDKKGLRAIAAKGLLRTQVVIRFDPVGEAQPETVKRTVVLRQGAGR